MIKEVAKGFIFIIILQVEKTFNGDVLRSAILSDLTGIIKMK
jgi:hypothetical protein